MMMAQTVVFLVTIMYGIELVPGFTVSIYGVLFLLVEFQVSYYRRLFYTLH